MSGQAFTFPPPPPPPPQAPQTYPTYSQPQQGYRGYGARNDRGGRGNRGGSRGGNFGFANSTSGYSRYSAGDNRQRGSQGGGNGAQANTLRQTGYPSFNYPPVQHPQYPSNIRQDYGHQPSSVPANSGYSSFGNGPQQYYNGQQPFPAYGHQPPLNGFQSTNAFHGSPNLPQPSTNSMIPFQEIPPNGNDQINQESSPASFQSGHYNHSNPFTGHRGRGQKRGHGEAFGKPRNHNPKPRAAPAVPSFGGPLPLPVKPPVPQDTARKPRKKKRKHNQLGLTPKVEEHESSEEEEDDVDEESKLAATVTGSGQGSQLLEFAYKGRTSTLGSSSEIAAWIEERKKRFPTKARAAEAAERKRQREEAQRAANEARRKFQEQKRQEANERQKLSAQADEKRRISEDAGKAAAHAKRKVEKLRKQLEKEERRVAKAEAKTLKSKLEAQEEGAKFNVSGKRKRSGSGVSSNTHVAESSTINSEEQDSTYINQPVVKVEPDTDISRPVVKAEPDTDISRPVVKAEPDVQINIEDSNTKRLDHLSSNDAHVGSQEVVPMFPDPLTPTSQPPDPGDGTDIKAFSIHSVDGDSKGSDQTARKTIGNPDNVLNVNIDEVIQDPARSMADSSSETISTESDDLTSSSGSSSTSSDSEDDAPDEAPSRRNGPDIVPPPKREKPKRICRSFLASGRCKKGDSCRYRHELPERGSRGAGQKDEKRTQGKTERVGLHQRLVNQEKEKEDGEILNAIVYLGEKGFLDPEVSHESTGN